MVTDGCWWDDAEGHKDSVTGVEVEEDVRNVVWGGRGAVMSVEETEDMTCPTIHM